ncbi:uracil-DNA glycosylase family protein [Ralstonia syzygii]|uniref:uracil-DNA glycosylase family protein n=1 Tax=Ralstonia syzygii TaxID=28097 RepID=UPI003515B44B
MQIHITNAVKCDVSADTGKSGRVVVPAEQASTCIKTFLLREFDILGTRGIVFFGANAQRYVLGNETPLWTVSVQPVGGRDYVVLRVPHTSPTAFNTHGRRGEAYVGPFREFCAAVAIWS